MTNFNQPTNIDQLIGLWDFNPGSETADTGLDDGIAQNGSTLDGNGQSPTFSGGQLHVGAGTNSSPTVFDVDADGSSAADDEQFNLDSGTLEVQFTQSSQSGSSEDVVVSRGEKHIDEADEGFFEIRVTSDGKVQVYHNTDNGTAVAELSTSAHFFKPGETVNAVYAFDSATGAQFTVTNVTTGEQEVLSVDVPGLTFDLTDNDDEEFTFGAREKDDGVYDKEFQGSIDYVALYTTEPAPSGPVDGEASGEEMVLGYDDSNAPTDQGGDQITNGDDLIFGNGGDDTINGAEGNDTIYGDDGPGGTSTEAVREVLEWSEVGVDAGDELGNFSVNTGNVTVQVSATRENAHLDIEYNTETINIDGIDTGDLGAANNGSSIEFESNSHSEDGALTLDFSNEVENVSFRIADLDYDASFTIKAYDAEGNEVPVSFVNVGSNIEIDADDPDGANTVEDRNPSNGESATSTKNSVGVEIAGPVAQIVIHYDAEGGDNSQSHLSDIYFDAIVPFDPGVAGNDVITGAEGADEIYGQDGSDTIIVDAASDADGDVVVGGNGPDDTADDDVLDLTGAGPVTVNAEADETDADAFKGTVTFSDGSVLTFSQIERIITDNGPDGVVDGEDFAEVMNPGYNDDNLPTDGGGDIIDGPDGLDDVIEGNGGDDTINAGLGNDTVSGGTGNDSIFGGPDEGADSIDGDEGNDSINGGQGNDTLSGGDDDDTVIGGAGDDLISGDDGDDSLQGDRGNDTIDGGEGDDIISGGQDDDLLTGVAGNDTISGNNDDDTITGGAGNDELNGNAGEDLIIGGSGDTINGGSDADTIVIDQDEVDENGENDSAIFVDGTGLTTDGIDNDTLDLTDFVQHRNLLETPDPDGNSTSGSVEVQNDDGEWVPVTFAEIENLLLPPKAPDGVVDGEEFGEVMNPLYDDANAPTDGGGDIIDGPDGLDDSIRGNGGDDTINAGEGNDTVDGGADNDSILGGDGDDSILGGDGDDTVRGEVGDDFVSGGAGNDSVTGGAGNDTLEGNAGGDSITGGSGDDVIDGGEGDDTITGSTGNDSITDLDGDNLINSDNPGSFNPDLGVPIGNVNSGFVVAAPDPDPFDNRDTITTGDGNDTINAGDDADVIDAGDGDNVVDAGTDRDTITTGSGDDEITGGEGDDLIDSGDGDDTIYGGINNPNANLIDDPNDGFVGDPILDNGDDTILAGAGNDFVLGEDDNDLIDGGTGDDTLDGGIDDDTVIGGEGNDVIIGGQGADSLDGGLGDDTFVVGTFTDPNGTGDYAEGVGDTIVGGEDPGDGDVDTLDLSGSQFIDILYEDSIDPTGTSGESGRVIFYTDNTETEVLGELTFREIENVIPCFTPGTLIATPKGEVPVETLREGDRVITRDNGIVEIRWTGARTLTRGEMAEAPNLKPILIKAGSLGAGLPERDMIVSPQHRMLVTGETPQLYFEESEVLVAAKHLVGRQGVSVIDTMRTTYIHFMFDRHEVVLSNGAWTESFQPGDQSLGSMGDTTRNEILALFPELATVDGLQDYAAARRSLKAHEARLLRL